MLDLYQELRSACGALDFARVPYLIVGGIAYSIHVELRATEDIDFLIDEDEWPRVKAALSPLGFAEHASPMDFKSVRTHRLTKLADDDYLLLDFLLADAKTKPSLASPVLIEFQGFPYRIASVETLVHLKRGRLSPKDVGDIAGLEQKYGPIPELP